MEERKKKAAGFSRIAGLAILVRLLRLRVNECAEAEGNKTTGASTWSLLTPIKFPKVKVIDRIQQLSDADFLTVP